MAVRFGSVYARRADFWGGVEETKTVVWMVESIQPGQHHAACLWAGGMIFLSTLR